MHRNDESLDRPSTCHERRLSNNDCCAQLDLIDVDDELVDVDTRMMISEPVAGAYVNVITCEKITTTAITLGVSNCTPNWREKEQN